MVSVAWRATACFTIVFGVAACNQPGGGWSTAQNAAYAADAVNFRERVEEMDRLFPAGNEGTEEARRQAASRLMDIYVSRRREIGLPDLAADRFQGDLAHLAEQPVRQQRQREQEAARRITEARAQAIARMVVSFDGRQVSQLDLTRAATARIDEEQSELRGMERRAAISQAEAELRQGIEVRRRTQAQTASLRREAELARLAGTNLADMPREIASAAEANVADDRNPFDTRPNWRPEPSAIRREEVRLREAVARRIERDRNDAQASAQAAAQAARRDAVVQQCRMQAAMMGAAVPSPYMGGGLGGAIASGLVGAMRQAEMEGNALQACLRASGY